jgi:hypothetical protein
MKKQFEFTTETIFPIIVILLSLINISNQTENIFSLSILVSLIGIVGTVLYFFKNPFSTKLIYIWIIAQVIIIEPFLDLSQGFSFKFGFTFATSNEIVGLNFNVLALLLLGFIKILEASNLVGKKVTLKEFRQSDLGDIFPINGIVTKRINLNNEKKWLLVELEKPFMYNGYNINHSLIKRKEDKTIKLKEKNQIIFFRLVYNEKDLENTLDKSKFPFIDWVLCE